jgi:hypothetical protein
LKLKPRNLVLGVVVVVAIALLVPVFNLNRYRRRVGMALGESLGRTVEIGDVHLQLLPWPGLIADNVIIGELPSVGAEPLARMSELRATLRVRSLLTGKPVFSSVVFVEPSVNLSRGNFAGASSAPALPDGAGSGGTAPPREFPYIEFRDGRINFKDGDLKQVFFFSQVEGALYRDGERLRMRFRGRPARTDRQLNGAGEIQVEGDIEPHLDLAARLIDSYLSDLLAVPTGVDPGIQGRVAVDLRLNGRPAALRFEGAAQIADLHRRDVLPPLATQPVRVNFTGSANLPGRRLDLAELRSEAGTVTAFGNVSGFLESPARRPQWDLQLRLNRADAGRWFTALRFFSPRLSSKTSSNASSDLTVTGTMDGSVHFLPGERGPVAEGSVVVEDLTLRAAGIDFETSTNARLEFSGPIVRLHPVALAPSGERALTASGMFDWTTPVRGASIIQLNAVGQDLALANMAPLGAALGWPNLPREGRVSVNAHLILERDEAPAYTGVVSMSKVAWNPPWLAQPVMIHTARINMAARHVRVAAMVLEAGESTITGSLEHAEGRAWQADLHATQLGSSDLYKLFATRQPIPESLGEVQARGKISVTRLRLRGLMLEEMQSSFLLADKHLSLRDARAGLASGRVTGKADVNFTKSGPEYEVSAKLTDVEAAELLPDLAAGPISGTVEIKANGGTAPEIADSLRLTGSFTGRALKMVSEALAQAGMAGTMAAEVDVRDRVIHFSRLTFGGPPPLNARGTVGFDRTIDLDFHTFHLTGTLSEPKQQESKQ